MDNCYSIERLENPFFSIQDYLRCDLPAHGVDDAVKFLDWVSSGGTGLGAGSTYLYLGSRMAPLRAEYLSLVEKMSEEIARKKAAGESLESIARWAVNERSLIAKAIRQKEGLGSVTAFAIRDLLTYGREGRAFETFEKELLGQGKVGEELFEGLIKKAVKPNVAFSSRLFKSAKFLKNGGLVTVIVTLPISAHAVLTAPEGEMKHVLAKETGNFVGSSLGTYAGVGLCLAFGVGTGGWGLLACGAIGGIAGGMYGESKGDQLYYINDGQAAIRQSDTGIIDSSLIMPMAP